MVVVPAVLAVPLVLLASACGSVKQTGTPAADAQVDAPPEPDAAIDSPPPDAPPLNLAVRLTGDPDPTTILAIDHCYQYPNNLVNSIWHFPTDLMISGHFSLNGLWSFPAQTGAFPTVPDVGTEDVNRLVHIPLTSTVVHSTNNQNSAVAGEHQIGSIDDTTGEISGFTTIQLSDNFAGNCDLISASPDEFLCFDGTDVRHYQTTPGSAEVTLANTVAISSPPACGGACFGGTFAFDGVFYYFPAVGNTSGGAAYNIFDADGALVETVTAPGGGNVNSVYFDWSIGRYASHDGFGTRIEPNGNNFASDGGSVDDSHCYSAVSPAHTR